MDINPSVDATGSNQSYLTEDGNTAVVASIILLITTFVLMIYGLFLKGRKLSDNILRFYIIVISILTLIVSLILFFVSFSYYINPNYCPEGSISDQNALNYYTATGRNLTYVGILLIFIDLILLIIFNLIPNLKSMIDENKNKVRTILTSVILISLVVGVVLMILPYFIYENNNYCKMSATMQRRMRRKRYQS